MRIFRECYPLHTKLWEEKQMPVPLERSKGSPRFCSGVGWHHRGQWAPPERSLVSPPSCRQPEPMCASTGLRVTTGLLCRFLCLEETDSVSENEGQTSMPTTVFRSSGAPRKVRGACPWERDLSPVCKERPSSRLPGQEEQVAKRFHAVRCQAATATVSQATRSPCIPAHGSG